jgi:hypothetical protein
MIESLYNKYFQKSKSFLYPALGIKRTSHYNPIETYIALDGLLGPEDMTLVCSFKDDGTKGFKAFEEQMLLTNPLYKDRIVASDYNIYMFDYSTYRSDWFSFVMGRYSKLSSPLKKAIKTYYGEDSSEYKYMESYLYPDKHFSVYAQLLGVSTSTLKKVGELCDPCDIEKETLKIPVELLENLKKVL